jgi:LuxR family maltose regulon positive regulatory protein
MGELPDGAQLALGGRVDPPLPLPRLRAEGGLFELRNEALALDRVEASLLVRQHAGGADDTVIEALLDATEGWATGLYLAALTMRDRPPEQWLSRLRGDQREIAGYLATEVLGGQPEEVRTFLTETAVAERLSPALCHALTGRDDAGELLPRLARDNLFITPLDDRDEWFRYHHLFAELLRAELERTRPDDVPRLHHNASAWFLERGDVDGGVRHLLAARDVDGAAETVAAQWTRYWDRGQIETVRRWLEAFDDREILDHPALTLTAGWVFSAVGDARQAQRWARAACSARMDDGPSPDGAASLRSSQAILRATIAPDGIAAMREEAELAVKLEAGRGSSWHADACQCLGAARWLSGAAQQAIRPLALAMREGAVFNPPSELAALGYLALIAADDDDWDMAREYERRATARLAELGFGSLRRSLPMLLARARVLAHDEDCSLDDVAVEIDDILSRLTPHVWLRLLGEITLGEVALSCGGVDEAERRRAQAQRLLDQYADAGMLRRRAERLRMAVQQKRVTEPLTAAESRVLELLPTHLTEAQIAAHLFVTRNTVKTHLRGLYRKLEASTRAEAVERARELGLLRALRS